MDGAARGSTARVAGLSVDETLDRVAFVLTTDGDGGGEEPLETVALAS